MTDYSMGDAVENALYRLGYRLNGEASRARRVMGMTLELAREAPELMTAIGDELAREQTARTHSATREDALAFAAQLRADAVAKGFTELPEVPSLVAPEGAPNAE